MDERDRSEDEADEDLWDPPGGAVIGDLLGGEEDAEGEPTG